MAKIRVAVVGVGTVGAMALWRLAATEGVDAVGYDRYAPGHDRGAAGGESRIFRVAYREGAQYVPLLREARGLWQDLEQAAGHRLFHPVGAVTVGPTDHPALRAVRDAAAACGLPLEELGEHDARERVPEHPLRRGESMLFDPLGGLLRPEPAVAAAAGQATASGATVHCYTPVLEVQDLGDQAVVVTGTGRHAFDRVILAPGPWGTSFPQVHALRVHLERITALWFPRIDDRQFDPSHTPVAIRVGDPAYSCFPAVDGAGVKIIPHQGFPTIEDMSGLTRAADRAVLDAGRRAVRESLPGVGPDPIRTGTFADLFTEDQHGYLGYAPRSRSVIVAAGFSGHGFKMSPALGRLAADMASDPAGAQYPDFLSPQRHLTLEEM